MYDGAGDDGDETLEAGHPFHCGQVGREGGSIQHNVAQTLQWFIFLKKSVEGARLHSYLLPYLSYDGQAMLPKGFGPFRFFF